MEKLGIVLSQCDILFRVFKCMSQGHLLVCRRNLRIHPVCTCQLLNSPLRKVCTCVVKSKKGEWSAFFFSLRHTFLLLTMFILF
uniref:Uncharacterized protein n=1 Tax=Anguilla anguilla TaxID=7936 RepID=A0A0E9X5V5_ANGAN